MPIIDCMLKRFVASAGSGCSDSGPNRTGAAGGSDGLEHFRDFRTHRQIKSQDEEHPGIPAEHAPSALSMT